MIPEAQAAKDRSAERPVDFVKKVGKGRTLSADLTAAEARTAFDLLLDGAFLPAQAGAFLQALRIKELTRDEIDALAESFRARMTAFPALSGRKTLVLNLASDTRRKGGLASLLAARLLRRFGVGVGLVRSASVLQKNTASFDATWDMAALLDGSGPLFPESDVSAWAPAPVIVDCGAAIRGLAALDELRSQLGFRSCLHTAEKLVNPWPASPMLLGISHKHYALRMAGALAHMGLSGCVLLGNHGTLDLVLHKETECVAVEAGVVREEAVDPAALGLELSADVYTLARFPQWRGWLEALTAGAEAEAPPAGAEGLRRAILYHLAFQLWVAGAAENPAAGLAAAGRAIPRLIG